MLFTFLSLSAYAQSDSLRNGATVPAHPRILLLKGEEKEIQRTLKGEAAWQQLHGDILKECDAMLALPQLERKLEGRRLLGVSRECIRRVFYLSYAWRMAGKQAYFDKAQQELMAVTAFSDWNPSHFLDVAEMTLGVAIGYDWLFDKLAPADKAIISKAILEKGIQPSLEPKFSNWLRVTNNWNQVCNTGMAYGALAIYEQHPELAVRIINRGLRSVVLPMGDYKPAGAYPEGYSYWGYGTSFNVLLISALEKVFGSDFGLSSQPGFLKTAGYMESMTGPTGASFNYSDAGNGGGLQPAMFWFANRQKDPSLLWVEKSRLEKKQRVTRERLLPATMLWGKGIAISKVKAPENLMWTGEGKNPVALMRTSWTDTNAIYAAIKGGSPAISHAHMDAGSFVMESDGVRWAMDMGMQDYNSLESKGIVIWDMKQESQRWKVFRYNNFAHNTLTVNGQLQNVKGSAPITATNNQPAFLQATTDISSLYNGELKKALRGIAVVDKQYVVVRDEIVAGDKPATIRWNLLTPADVKISGDNTAELTKNGKKLTLKVDAPVKVTMKTWSTTSDTDYDAPNPGTTFTGFEVTVPAGFSGALNVYLIPEKSAAVKPVAELTKWPKNQ